MPVEDIGALLALVKGFNREYAAAGGVSVKRIAEAEQSLGVRFPRSYKSFLREVGFALWPVHIYGLRRDHGKFYDVVRLTQSERYEMEPPMKHSLVALSPDGWGNHFCLDTEHWCGKECPVVLWNHELEADQVTAAIQSSFGDWLADRCAQVRDNHP